MATLIAHATLIQTLEQAFIKPIIQLFIRPTQGRPADRLIAEVVTVVPLTTSCRLNVPQASASQIQVSVPILVAGKVRYHGRPWPDSSFVINGLFRNNIVTTALESGLFLYANWDSSGSNPFRLGHAVSIGAVNLVIAGQNLLV